LVASSDRLIRTPALFRRCAISTRTAVAAYGSFLLAEYFHFSDVLATVAAGFLIGNLGIRDHAALPADFVAFSTALAASVSAETSSSNWSVTPSMEGVRSPAFSIK
jgi:hypothetical protein